MDSDRDGKCNNFYDALLNPIKDFQVYNWLDHDYGGSIGRLIFLIDSCFSGHYTYALAEPGEPRIIMASSSQNEPAQLETSQDWGAFSFKFFKSMSDGETTVMDAFNKADYHVDVDNFFSIWVIKKWDYFPVSKKLTRS